MLTNDQKRNQLNITRYLLSRYEDDPWRFYPKIRHWFTTLAQSQTCRANNGSTLAHPPKKFKRVHSTGKVKALLFWNSQGVIMLEYLEQGRMTNGAYYAGELRNCKEEARKTYSWCSTLSGHHICQHFTSFYDCCD